MLHKSYYLVHKIKYHPKPIKTNELPTFFFLFPYFLSNQTQYNLTKKEKEKKCHHQGNIIKQNRNKNEKAKERKTKETQALLEASRIEASPTIDDLKRHQRRAKSSQRRA